MELVSIVVSRHNIKQQNVLGLCIQSRNSKLHLGKHLSEKRERGNVSVVLLSVPRPRQLTKDNEGGNCDNYSVHVGYPLENCFVGSPKLFTTSNHCSPFCRPPHPESHLVAPLTPSSASPRGNGNLVCGAAPVGSKAHVPQRKTTTTMGKFRCRCCSTLTPFPLPINQIPSTTSHLGLGTNAVCLNNRSSSDDFMDHVDCDLP